MRARKGSRIAPDRAGASNAWVGPPVRTAIMSVCMHKNELRPTPALGDEVWCSRCREYRKVILLQSEYRARCRECRYSRTFGRASFAADKAARAHGDRTGHAVDRFDGSTLEWTYRKGAGTVELTLDTVGDEPPY
jgi:hypothetical protein